MIISASRRTDIPAFYSDWFMEQIRKGIFYRKNPYNNEIISTSVSPEITDVIVFWTRNPQNMMRKGYLNELTDLGYKYYFQYTITGYQIKSNSGCNIDGSTPHPLKAIETFNKLADDIGINKLIWRFDPIIVNNDIPKEHILKIFNLISQNINPELKRVVISFLDDYQKVSTNMKKTGFSKPVDLVDSANQEILNFLLNGLIGINQNYNDRKIYTCAESIDLTQWNIKPSKCIDDQYIKDVFGIKVSRAKDQGQRKACGCIKSVDVGMYNTCIHNCAYCYATQEKETALQNYKEHDKSSPFIIKDNHLNLNNRII